MKLLDISSSNYIWQQGIILGVVGLLCCLSIFGVAAYRFKKGMKGRDFSIFQNDEKGIAFILISLSFFLWFFCFLPKAKDSYHLMERGVETTGKTIEWINKGEGEFDIRFSFFANGETFTNQCGRVYNGSTIEQITCPGGEYVVIYEDGNPFNSVMDFKRQK